MRNVNHHIEKRISYQRYKKMKAHIDELTCFIMESLGALKNMIDAGMEEEYRRRRKGE